MSCQCGDFLLRCNQEIKGIHIYVYHRISCKGDEKNVQS
jgi:hypothetical protein